MAELWKTIKDHPKYKVSNLGRAKCCYKNGQEKILRLIKRADRRLVIGFRLNGESTQRRIHRLVAQAFIPNPENKPQINHKNGNTFDNRVENLEWCDQFENMRHAYKIGIKTNKGDKAPGRKLNSKIVKEIRQKYGENRTELQKEIAKEYNISRRTISAILNFETWKEAV